MPASPGASGHDPHLEVYKLLSLLRDARSPDRSSLVLEKRSHARYQTCLSARLIAPDSDYSQGCTVRDLSEGGARVSAMSLAQVPQRLYLYVEHSGDMWECEVRWQRADEAGRSGSRSPRWSTRR